MIKIKNGKRRRVKRRERRIGDLILPPRRQIYAMAMVRSEMILRGECQDG